MTMPVVKLTRGRTHLHRYLEKASLKRVIRDVRKLRRRDLAVIFEKTYDPDIPVRVYRSALYLLAKRGERVHTTLKYYRTLTSANHFSTRQLEAWLDGPNLSPRTAEFYKQKYGCNWRPYFEDARRRANPYDEEYVAKRYGLSARDAAREVARRKKNTAGSYASFLRRAGGDPVEARRRFREFCAKSAHTEESFRKKFGAGYKTRWEAYKKSKNSYDLDKYVEKYGSVLGRKQLLARVEKSVVDYFKYVEMYGERNAEREYVKYCYRKTKHWKRKSGRWGATRESLDFFGPILRRLDARRVGYRVGVEGNRELMLLDRNSGKVRYYDLCIPSVRLVVEFDGVTHPSPLLSGEQLARWRCRYSGVSAEARLSDDEAKRRLAVSKGYQFLRFHIDEVNRDPRRYRETLWATINALLKEKRK